MAGHRGGLRGFRDFEAVAAAVSEWVRLWRIALSARNEVGVATPREVAHMAAALGIAPGDANPVVGERPSPAPLLRQMLVALGLEPDAAALVDHARMDELQRLCTSCEHKAECAHDLAEGTATDNFYAYCPNARALDSIYVEMTFNRP